MIQYGLTDSPTLKRPKLGRCERKDNSEQLPVTACAMTGDVLAQETHENKLFKTNDINLYYIHVVKFYCFFI